MEGKDIKKVVREHPEIINVSNKRNSSFYVFLGKQLLKEHGEIEFQALGNAVSIAVMSAENLVRNEYAEFKEIRTQTINMDRKENEKEGQAKKAKLFIKLVKHADFEKNYENFEKIRAENDKVTGGKKSSTPAAEAH